jgi:hypothetical protein
VNEENVVTDETKARLGKILQGLQEQFDPTILQQVFGQLSVEEQSSINVFFR